MLRLSFGLGRQDTGCQAIQLRDDVGAEIADFDGTEADGVIKTQNISNYCFYRLGDGRDPDMGFVTKRGAACAQDTPAQVKVLNNPQFIWMAYETCKDEQSCETSPLSTNNLRLLQRMSPSNIKDSLARRLPFGNKADSDKVDEAVQKGDPELKGVSKKAGRLLHGLALCASVGIAGIRCFDHHFAEPSINSTLAEPGGQAGQHTTDTDSRVPAVAGNMRQQ